MTRDGCGRVGKLRLELATASEGSRIELRETELRDERRRLVASGAGQDADPQASAIARLVGRLLPSPDLRSIRSGIVGLFAILLEGWSAFGLYLCGVRHGHQIARIDAAPLFADPSVAPAVMLSIADGTVDSAIELTVTAWAVQQLHFEEAGRLRIADAFADYVHVADLAGRKALRMREFRRNLFGALLELECEVWGDEIVGVMLSPTSDRANPIAENEMPEGARFTLAPLAPQSDVGMNDTLGIQEKAAMVGNDS